MPVVDNDRGYGVCSRTLLHRLMLRDETRLWLLQDLNYLPMGVMRFPTSSITYVANERGWGFLFLVKSSWELSCGSTCDFVVNNNGYVSQWLYCETLCYIQSYNGEKA